MRALLEPDGDFYDALSIYERLAFREWLVPGYSPPLVVSRKCYFIDVLLSLWPGENRLGPWRVLLRDRTVALGFDEDIVLVPDLPPNERNRLVKANVIWY